MMAAGRPHPAARSRAATAVASVGLFATIGGGIAVASHTTTTADSTTVSVSDDEATTEIEPTTVATDEDWSATEPTSTSDAATAPTSPSRSVATSGGS